MNNLEKYIERLGEDMEILIATKNEGKIRKYAGMLEKLNIRYKTLKEFEDNINVEETGKNPNENSKIKAKAYYNKFKMPLIVDDCALVIDKLPIDKQPGVFVRRHNGKRLSDEEMIDIYSKEIERIGGESTGAFLISITIIDQNGEFHTSFERHERLFVSKPCKTRIPGYPMNSLIYIKENNTYLAENNKNSNAYKTNSLKKEFEFIKSVLGGNDERKK